MGKWEMVRLGDVCTKTENDNPNLHDGEIIYIDISSINSENKKIMEYNTITSKDAPSRARQKIRYGDILVSTVRPNLNAVAIVDNKAENLIASTGFCVLRPNNKRIDGGYLFEFVKAQSFILSMTSQARGASYPAVSNKIVMDECIPLPPLERQKKIADILARTIALIEKRKAQITKLDLLVKSRFMEMFENGKFELVKLEDICGFITKGTTPPTNQIYKNPIESGIPYLKVYNLSDTGVLFFWKEPQYIDAETHNTLLARSKVYPNDVLMNIVGLPLGKFALVTNDYEEWNINQAIAIFRSKERVLPIYLLYAMMQPDVLRPFLEQGVGIRQINLSLKQCRELEIPLPPLDLQARFTDFVCIAEKTKSDLRQGLNELELLYKSLRQKCFNGEIS